MPYIQVEQARLFYLEQGTGEIPLVFGHGTLISSNIWRDFYFPRLPDNWQAFALDFRGHGASKDVQSGCNFARMAEDIAEITIQKKLGKVFYVGLSMGGGVGMQLALNHQDVLRGLVLLSPVTGLGSLGNPAFTKIVPLMLEKRRLLRFAMRLAASKKPSKRELDAVVEEAMQVSPAVMREYLSPANIIKGMERANRIDVPVLLIVGLKDKVIPVRQQLLLGETIPNCQVEIEKNSGHALSAEKPDWVLNHIKEFVSKHL